jgi:hypothetical protein
MGKSPCFLVKSPFLVKSQFLTAEPQFFMAKFRRHDPSSNMAGRP